jgi:hypothetical protein
MTLEEADVRPYTGKWTEDDLELFGAYEKLYRVTVEGREFWVPEKNCVLRSCQYIEMYSRVLRMPWRDYCWNNTDGCCEMSYRETPGAPLSTGRACRVAVTPGMEIVRLPKGGRFK